MGDRTSIEWTDATWNPTTGCTKVSAGCDHCYAERLALGRLRERYLARRPASDNAANRRDPFSVRLWPKRVEQPRAWTDRRMIFVNSMSDLFHNDIPEEFLRRVFEVMLAVPRHIYQVLTKRPARAHRFWKRNRDLFYDHEIPGHIWIGTSVEDQQVAYRISQLKDVPAKMRFLSCEPLIGPLVFDNLDGIHWVIAGGESGPDFRTVEVDWLRSIRDQCNDAGVPFFFKQWGGATPKARGRRLDGRVWSQYPASHNGAVRRDMAGESTNVAYWRDYDGLQKTKHELLGRYLDAWFPILSASGDGLLLYVDSHAGRGRHETGQAGSPVLVLDKLLKHKLRERILSRCRVHLHLFETEAANADSLEREMASFTNLPSKIKWKVHREDYAHQLSRALEALEAGKASGVPSFAFVDPFGFTLSMALLNRFLRAGYTELLITFMLRYVDMAIAKGDKEEILNDLFGSDSWKRVRGITDYNERVEAIISAFAAGLEGHVRWVIMRGDGGEVKYVLFYATQSVRGLQVFKDAVYAVIPDGSYTAFERDRPEQTLLFGTNIEPPFKRIRELLWARFAGKTVSLQNEIYETIDLSLFRRTHAHQVIREDVAAGLIENLNEPGKFVISHNPTLRFGQPAAGAARPSASSSRDARAARA